MCLIFTALVFIYLSLENQNLSIYEKYITQSYIPMLLLGILGLIASGRWIYRSYNTAFHYAIWYALLFVINYVLLSMWLIFSTEIESIWWSLLLKQIISWVWSLFVVVMIGAVLRKWFQWGRKDVKELYGEKVSRRVRWIWSILVLWVGWFFLLLNQSHMYDTNSSCEENYIDSETWAMIVDINCTWSHYNDFREHSSPKNIQEEIIVEEKFTISNGITTSPITRLHIQKITSDILWKEITQEKIDWIIQDITLTQHTYYAWPESQKADELRKEYEDRFVNNDIKSNASKILEEKAMVQSRLAYQEMLITWFLWELKIDYVDENWKVLYTAIRAPNEGTWWSLDSSHIADSFHLKYFHRDFVEFDINKHHKLRILDKK